MTSIGDVAARLRAVLALVEGATRGAKAADDQMSGAHAQVQDDLTASANPLAEEGLAKWGAARERLSEAPTLIAGGTQRMSDYIASIAGGTTSSGSAPASPTPNSPSPSDRSTEFNPRRFDASKLAGLRRYGEAGTAEGRLYLGDGSPYSERVLRATTGNISVPSGKGPQGVSVRQPRGRRSRVTGGRTPCAGNASRRSDRAGTSP